MAQGKIVRRGIGESALESWRWVRRRRVADRRQSGASVQGPSGKRGLRCGGVDRQRLARVRARRAVAVCQGLERLHPVRRFFLRGRLLVHGNGRGGLAPAGNYGRVHWVGVEGEAGRGPDRAQTLFRGLLAKAILVEKGRLLPGAAGKVWEQTRRVHLRGRQGVIAPAVGVWQRMSRRGGDVGRGEPDEPWRVGARRRGAVHRKVDVDAGQQRPQAVLPLVQAVRAPDLFFQLDFERGAPVRDGRRLRRWCEQGVLQGPRQEIAASVSRLLRVELQRKDTKSESCKSCCKRRTNIGTGVGREGQASPGF